MTNFWTVFLRQGKLFWQNNDFRKRLHTVSGDRRQSEILIEYFINVTKTLHLKPNIVSALRLYEFTETCKDHTSIQKKFYLQMEECQFKFHSVSENEVVLNMNEKRRT